ncbi:MAG: hypothetical protein BM564_03650 [Bacteroidetes bacterium MedPE-SWsnd-G2]|nr:MAG: hypothetical protein BM564_03650 [Bacteroidetes bacterium MedPE-SWsnd-G2]
MITCNIIGAGNVANHLYKTFKKSDGIQINQWYARNASKIELFKTEVEIITDINNLRPADVTILAVNDDVINEVSQSIPFENHLVVHTSGAAVIYDLDKKHKRGVFYPLQTFTAGADLNFEDVPICLEVIHKSNLPVLTELANCIGSPNYRVNPDQRKVLHLAAVFVNNFTNQLYRLGHEITESEGVEFEILKPLITETANKIASMSPYMAQTGPAVRNDKKTIKKHLKLLNSEHHKEVYNLLTKSIKKTHGFKKL